MTGLRLHTIADAHFVWLLGEWSAPEGLTQPPGGVDASVVVAMLRGVVADLHRAGCRGHWLMIDGLEVVGLGGFKRPPDAARVAEIGYGIAASRRGGGTRRGRWG